MADTIILNVFIPCVAIVGIIAIILVFVGFYNSMQRKTTDERPDAKP